MHPAPSVILFTVLSGLGFGFLAMLALDVLAPTGWQALIWWGVGYELALAGLIASTFHLGQPRRALRAFTQWRSSWLSREAWAAAITLAALAPLALADAFAVPLPAALGDAAGFLCFATVFCTAMIYTQLKSVPRWNHAITPVIFLSFALVGGMILARHWLAPEAAFALAGVMGLTFWIGDGRFAKAGASLGSATGLDRLGEAAVFELPHTSGNYLLREMIHVVGRKHALKLRWIAVGLASVLPGMILLVPLGLFGTILAALCHLIGALAARWLFFAEAEHVVGLYYGKR